MQGDEASVPAFVADDQIRNAVAVEITPPERHRPSGDLTHVQRTALTHRERDLCRRTGCHASLSHPLQIADHRLAVIVARRWTDPFIGFLGQRRRKKLITLVSGW